MENASRDQKPAPRITMKQLLQHVLSLIPAGTASVFFPRCRQTMMWRCSCSLLSVRWTGMAGEEPNGHVFLPCSYHALDEEEASNYKVVRQESLTRYGRSQLNATSDFHLWRHSPEMNARSQFKELLRITRHWLQS